jgi:hypothetical protein
MNGCEINGNKCPGNADYGKGLSMIYDTGKDRRTMRK